METEVKVIDGRLGGETALIEYTGRELIFFTKPKWVRILFGVLGDALATYKERFRINILNLTAVTICSNRRGEGIMGIEVCGEENCKIKFERNDLLLIQLKNALKDKVRQ